MQENCQNQALAKYQLIKPFMQGEKKLTLISHEKKISLKTLRTWVKIYRDKGLKGLFRKSRNDNKVRRSCSENTQQLIEGLYLQNPHLSLASIHRNISEYLKNKKLHTPSYRTVYDIIKQIPKNMKVLAHEGRKSYKQKFDLLYTREATAANKIWQADHMLLDIFLILNEKQKRPWLTVILDDYSRAIAGYELSFMDPSSLKTALCLRQAIWRNTSFAVKKKGLN